MKTYNIRCPYCGYMNRNVYLGETNGWMECLNCGSDVLANSKVYKGMDVFRQEVPKEITEEELIEYGIFS